MRSFLTMLGVTIGVASITIILSLSSGASKIVSNQIDSLGGNITVVRPGSTKVATSDLTHINAQQNFSASSLTEYDLGLIKKINHVAAAAPLMIMNGTIKADSVAPSSSLIVATTPELGTISNLTVQTGQFLDSTINQDTVVIGPQLAINIFGTDQAIGKNLTIHGKTLTVIGVLKRTNNPINYDSVDFDNAAIISLELGKQLGLGQPQIQQIDIRSDSVADLSRVIIDINKSMLISHDGENDFSVLSGDQISQPTSQLFFALAGATTAIAGISLLVGGIGIMNIMLVNVAERTREIGIRKALGANNGDIAAQFMIESIALGIGGGICGYIFGYIVAFGISTFLTFQPVMNWQIAGIAGFISIVMGTVFGLYPAFRASSKDPIESLREYN
jgi:ABC-type antimicrobial peptide transport system permease subunit